MSAREEAVAEYQDAVRAAALCAHLLAAHDLSGILRAIEHADSFGPFLDPTLWREKQKAMNEDRELLLAALSLAALGKARAKARP